MNQLPARHSLQAWLLATRPATLTAALAPVLTGTALAYHLGALRILPGILAVLGALVLQVLSNFANDVFDYEKGSDTEARLGPTRAVQAGLISPNAMKRGLVILVVLALGIGSGLAYLCGWPIVAIGIASIIAAVAYTGGPYPLGYHGLGDVFVFLFFGFVAVCGMTFVHLGEVPFIALIASLPSGALATNILVVNNIRDQQTDILSGKRTLAVRFGSKAAQLEYQFLSLLAYLTPVIFMNMGWANYWVLLPLLTLPLNIRLNRDLKEKQGKALNQTLVSSAKLVFLYGLTFALGLLLASL